MTFEYSFQNYEREKKIKCAFPCCEAYIEKDESCLALQKCSVLVCKRHLNEKDNILAKPKCCLCKNSITYEDAHSLILNETGILIHKDCAYDDYAYICCNFCGRIMFHEIIKILPPIVNFLKIYEKEGNNEWVISCSCILANHNIEVTTTRNKKILEEIVGKL